MKTQPLDYAIDDEKDETIDKTKWNKGYCSLFWDSIFGIYIGFCCKIHDENCSTVKFFKCLKKEVKNHAYYIAIGGAIGCIVKYPYRMIKKI